MQHWVDTLNAATSIVASKAKQMENEKLMAYIGVAVLAVILIGAIIELFNTLKPKEKNEDRFVRIPQGASILITAGGAESA